MTLAAKTKLSIIALFLLIITPCNAQTTAEELHKKGFEYGSLGEFEKAKDVFEKALKIRTNNPTLQNHLRVIEYVNEQKIDADLAISYFKTIAYTSVKQWDKAVEESSKALKLNPEFAEAYINRGNIYLSEGQMDNAMSDFNEAIKLRPEDPFLYILRGNAYDKKGQTDSALSDYDKAIEIDPQFALAYSKRGYVLHVRKREFDNAISEYNKAISLDPQDPSFYILRGGAYHLKGQEDKAAADLKKAEELGLKFTAPSNEGSKSAGGSSQGNRAIPITSYEILPQPILSTLEQTKEVDPFTLGKGYLTLESALDLLEVVAKRSNITLIFLLNGQPVKVTHENAATVIQDFNNKLQIYQQALEQRGYSKFDGFYTLDVNKEIQGKEYFDLVTLFADSELSRHEYLLAQEIQITQQGFRAQLIRKIEIGGEIKNLNFSGLAVGNSVILSVPNIKMFFYGVLNNNTIELKIDPNELKRSQSFAAAVQTIASPEKTTASDFNKTNYSDWLVRLQRTSSNKPVQPMPTDQLLIITPDKKIRKVVREEID